MAVEKRSESLMDRIWKFFVSLRLAIVVLILIAIFSIAGTVIEQNQPVEKYRQFYSEGTIRAFDAIGLFDMYHAWWFNALLMLFTVNLACCTIDRFPRAWRIVRDRKLVLDEGMERSLGMVDKWKKKGKPEPVAAAYEAALAGAFGKPVATRNSDTVHLYAERGAIGRFGVYITHLSIIVIFLGAILGNVLGFKGYVNIVEGQSVREVMTRGGGKKVDLGYEVRCNRFWVEHYPNGQPKEYSSDLSVIENGREVLRKTIEVNDPLRYKGIWFYQSSYGSAGGTGAQVAVRRTTGEPVANLTLSPGTKAEIPGYGTVSAVDYNQNYMGFGPALRVVLEKPGKPAAEFWLLRAHPEFDRQRSDAYFLSFAGLDEVFYTGLQVAKDPGVNIVWVGCALMTVGLLVAFFVSHRRVWVRIAPAADGRVEVTLAGSAHRNRLAFEKKFEKMQADLKQVSS